MADRYWRGGTGTWNTTNTANWSTTSGGSTGASVPTSADNVFFDANSNVGTGSFTVTIGASVNCANFTASGLDGAMTLAIGVQIINVFGNWSNQASNFAMTGSGGTIEFELSAGVTSTIITNGYTFPTGLYVAAVGSTTGTLRLDSALTLASTSTGRFYLDAGTLNLNGFTLTCGLFVSSSSTTRSISFGSSNIVLSSATAATTIMSMNTLTNFSWTGTGGFVRTMNATATVTVGTTGGTVSNAPNLSITGGASTLTITSGSWFKNLNFTGSTSTVNAITQGVSIAGVLTLATGGTYSNAIFGFAVTATLDVTATPKTLGGLRVNGTGITVTLARNTTIAATGATTLTEGTLDLNGFSLSTGVFALPTSGANAKSITFGSQSITLSSATASTTILSMANMSGFSWTGTGGFIRNQAATATLSVGSTQGGTTSNAPNLTVNAGASSLTITSTSWFRNINFTGSTCTITGLINIAGVLTLATGGSYTGLIPTFRVTATLDTLAAPNNKQIGGLGVNGTGIIVTLARDTVVSTSSNVGLALTEGTLDLNGFGLSTTVIDSNNSNTRSIVFGSSNITLTAITPLQTIISMATATNFTWSGTGGFVRSQGNTATVVFGTTGGSTSNAINLTVNAGAATLSVTSGSWFNNLNFTGSACSVTGVGGGNTIINVAGNLTLATGGTYTAVRPLFVNSSTVTSVGKSLNTVTINGAGITVTLADAMSVGSNSITLTNGTLDLNGFSLTVDNFQTAAGTKNITFNGGTIYITAASTGAWSNGTNAAGFTTTAGTGVGTISLTSSSAKSFQGGGSTYNCTINQGGAGNLTITGSNTFDNITNTVQPASVLFTAGTTNTFNNFNLSGTSGNLISIGSVTAASHTLSKSSGTVSVSFCSISRSDATGGAAWEAYTSNGNVDAGNNTGWVFALPVIYNVLIDEQAIAEDLFDKNLIIDRFIDETINGFDEFDRLIIILNKYISEDAIALDSIEETLVLQKGIDEFSNAQDSQSSNSILVVSQSESAQADDETISVQIYPKSLSEQANIDSFNVSQVVLGISFIDETANIASDNYFVYGSFPVNISETALALDLFSRNLVITNNIFEEAVAGDLQNYVLNIAKSFSDQANISSANNFAYAAIFTFITEFSLADDAVATGAFTRARSVANIAISSSAVSETKTSLRSLGESSSATDLIGRNYVIQFQVDDAAAAIAAFQSRPQIQPVQISESLSVSDLNSWAYYWSIVVDTQTANWQNVVDTQSPTWVTVQDTQTANWQNVTDTQSPSWSDVGTNQTPNWQQIN